MGMDLQPQLNKYLFHFCLDPEKLSEIPTRPQNMFLTSLTFGMSSSKCKRFGEFDDTSLALGEGVVCS